MQDRSDRSGASPMVTESAMHVVAIVAIIVVGVALFLLTAESARSLPNDARDEAVTIESVPYRDDAVDLSAAAVAPEGPTVECVSLTRSAWYAYEPQADVPLTAWVVPDLEVRAALDVALVAWRRAPDGTMTEIACIDERGDAVAEQLVMSAEAGGEYFFQVAAEQSPDSRAGTVTFLLDEQRPAHDLFAFARWVDRTPYVDGGVDASGARREPDETHPSCAQMEATTWYGISTPVDAVLAATVRPSGRPAVPSDVALALHTGDSVGSLMEMACVNAEAVQGLELLEAPLTGGEVYWLQVGAVLDGDAGPGIYDLEIKGLQSIELAPIPDAEFGGRPLAIAVEASSGLPVSIEVDGPCRVRGRSLSMLGAGLCTITATQPGDDEWSRAVPAATTLRIDRGRQPITIKRIGPVVVGDRRPIRASAASGSPVALEVTGPCTVEEGSLVAVGAGACVLTADQAGDADWAPAESVTVTIPVGRGQPELTLGDVPTLTVGERVDLVATSSAAGLPLTITAEGSCRVRGETLLGTGAGPCTITASQAGDDDWAPAEPVTTTVRIGRGAQAIELGPIADTVFGAAPLALEAEAVSGLPVAFSVDGPCRVRGEDLVSTGAGTCVLTASQAGDADWAPAEPVIERITIAPAAQALELAAVPALTVGDTVELTASSDSGLPVAFEATGPCRVEAGSLVARRRRHLRAHGQPGR